MFDGVSPSLVRDVSVVIDDGAIMEVADGGVSLGCGDILDLGDVTLLPGLVDAHQHLVFDASDDPVGHLRLRTDSEVLDGARIAAQSALCAGITTIRDLGDRTFLLLGLRREFAEDPTAGPELLVAGPPITTPRGHCWFLGGTAAGVHSVRTAVRARAERGVDVIKVMISGGSLTQGSSNLDAQYSIAELSAIVDEARELGLPVTGHAKSVDALKSAVDCGFDGVEHGPYGCDLPSDDLGRLVERGTYVTMTAAFKPPKRHWVDPKQGVFAAMHTAGVPLALASDGGISSSVPHDALPYGVPRLLTIGMSSADALRSVTSVAARVCALGHRKGQIWAGYDADMIAVGGDPLADLNVLLDVRHVLRAGTRVRIDRDDSPDVARPSRPPD
jgi:imidazolonepropionase-like amidohydrolase